MTCTFCGGIMEFLGRLGCLDWFRCQDCGLDQDRYNATGQGVEDELGSWSQATD